MKNILMVLFFLVCVSMHGMSQQNAHQQLAAIIARKMADTLALTTAQKDQVYAINIQLAGQKSNVRQQYTVIDSVRYHLQKIENTRDSLYRPVLGEDKFILYKQKKRNLVSNN